MPPTPQNKAPAQCIEEDAINIIRKISEVKGLLHRVDLVLDDLLCNEDFQRWSQRFISGTKGRQMVTELTVVRDLANDHAEGLSFHP